MSVYEIVAMSGRTDIYRGGPSIFCISRKNEGMDVHYPGGPGYLFKDHRSGGNVHGAPDSLSF